MLTTHFDKVLDNLLTAIVVLDADLGILYMNAAAENMLRISGQHTQGTNFGDYFAEGDDTPYSIKDALSRGVNFTKRRARWQLANAREMTVDYSVTPDQDENHVVLEAQALDRLLRISRDEAWIASQETTNNMVRSMAHEIKNPLGGIRGAAQLLSRELEGHELDEFTKIIIDETDRLRRLTDRMLGPNKPVHHRPVNIHEVLEHVSSVTNLNLPDSIRLNKDYDPSIPDLLGDKEQLIQATLNIVNNAVQALEENKIDHASVTLKTRIRRRFTIGRKNHRLIAEVSIIDNGPGIPPELVEDIFFPMITGRAEGTGLGLAISQNLITRHEGLIEVSSIPGNTEFKMYLPLGTANA
ncbi:nitrogen regulation protein NR(II) [Agaribacterium haliotis]|uniref:nitrogen regulation protein NR(II) n=1 Tax=Agaribacterium haliotis TaxID=2013869 RepID=UPI000BB557F9|nr:nitrogen regulation protein NR(II) [Agaribacterium haliotis]